MRDEVAAFRILSAAAAHFVDVDRLLADADLEFDSQARRHADIFLPRPPLATPDNPRPNARNSQKSVHMVYGWNLKMQDFFSWIDIFF